MKKMQQYLQYRVEDIYKRMDQQLRQISSFLRHKQCIFEFEEIDYPSIWQQQFINSYFYLNKIMEKQHTQIIRQLHSFNDKTLEIVSQGFIYSSLLNLDLFHHYTQYIIILRVQIWTMITRNMQVLLNDYFDLIKLIYTPNILSLYKLIVSYSSPQPELTRLIIQSMVQYETVPQKVAINLKILEYFEQMLKSTQTLVNEESCQILYHSLFLKCLRLIAIPVYQKQSKNIIEKLWESNQSECSIFLFDNLIAIETQPITRKQAIIDEIYKKLQNEKNNHTEQYQLRQMIFGCLLPKKVQMILQYLLVTQNLDYSNIRIQLNWLERTWSANKNIFIWLLVDMGVWVSLSFDNVNCRVYILDWTLRKVSSLSQNTYKVLRNYIFERWFRNGPGDQFMIVSIFLLRYMIYNDSKIANDLLTYILKNGEQNEENIKRIFKFAHRKGYLKFDELNLSETISLGVKEALRDLIGGYSVEEEVRENKQSRQNKQKYLPDLPQLRNRSQSIQLNYDSPKVVSIPTKITNETYVLNVQEQYMIKMCSDLNNILDDPNLQNFKKFFKKVCQLGIACRKEDDIQQLNKICEQSAKIIYIMFNYEFEDFNMRVVKEESIIYFLLQFIVTEWHRVTHKLQIYKQIVKFLMKYFPNTEPAIWRYFFLYFEYGGANNRSVKNWLISTEQAMSVLPILQALCEKLQEGMKRNMHSYGLKPL